jgi:hypothetical protein
MSVVDTAEAPAMVEVGGVDGELLTQVTQLAEMGTELPSLDADPAELAPRGVYSALLAGVQRSMM